MAQGVEFPAYVKLEHRADGSTEAAFVAEVDKVLASAGRKLDDFSAKAQQTLNQALSVKRNDAGALDLGVPQMREAAQAQQLRAIAAREVADATLAAARATGTYTQEEKDAIAAARGLAAQEQEKARAMLASANAAEQVQAQLNRTTSATGQFIDTTGRGTDALGNNINSVRASRVAFVQLGQQMQDVVIQAQMGTNAMQIFAQQVPQAAFALTGLADSANATQRRIGAVATFLSGPWGAAIFAATAVLGPFIYSLFQSGEAADDAKNKTFDFAGGLDVLSLSAADATSAMDQLTQSLRSAIKLQGDFLEANAAVATQSVASLEARIASNRAELSRLKREADGPLAFALPSVFGPSGADLRRRRALETQIAADQSALGGARNAAAAASIATGQRNVAERRDPNLRTLREIDEQIGRLNRRREQSARDNDRLSAVYITQEDYEAELGRLVGLREAAEDAQRTSRRSGSRRGSSRSGRSEVDKAAREAQQLADYADRAAERIQRINEQFDEQPRLIDQANRASRELDDIIADLEKRKPIDWQKMVSDAQAAQGVIEQALVRPFEELRQESERRVEIERLLTAGRDAEAEALQLIWQMESRLDPLSEERKADVMDIVAAEREHLELLRRQQDHIGQYLEATRAIRGELESFFAGEGANFGRIFRRLQAQYTVEALFGDALRNIDKGVQSAYDKSSERLSETTDPVERDLADLGNAARGAAAALSGRAAGTSGPGAVNSALGGLIAGGSASLGRFTQGVRSRAVNDNGVIVVTGQPPRADRDTLGGMTPERYFDLVQKSMTDRLVAELERLGIALPDSIKGAIGGALGGYVTAGPIGGVLGGLKGLVDSAIGDEPNARNLALLGASETLKQGLGGAQTGAQIDGIFKSLGIKSSKTGASLGGAAGAITGLPFGKEIGSILGGLLGGALKSAKRGSAIIGGGANGLDVTGFYGNSGSRKDQAGGFGNSAIETVNRIAQQLGASLDASRGKVSIGVREDKIFVDPQGRGYTKASKYKDIVGFGDDAEAAIRFAVKNLIEDGVIGGLKDSEMRLLRAGKDIEKAMQDVLDFRAVFKDLRAYKDPVGTALDELDTEFKRLEDLFMRAGASASELAQLEELYGIRRAEAVEQAMERVGGALRELVGDLTRGDMGLSLRDRRANTLGEYNALRTRVEGGDVTAFDKYAEVARQLLEIERELFGSQSGYFDRFNEVKGTSQAALAEQQRIADAAANRDSPFSKPANDNQPVVDSINWLGGHLLAGLDQSLGGRLDRMTAILSQGALNQYSDTSTTGALGLLPRTSAY